MEKSGLISHHSIREIQCYDITIADIAITLHPYKVIYIPDMKTLLIADVHIGKVSHFRKNGMAIPSTIIDTNFLRLNHCLEFFNPDEIYFLGDLFHSRWNN